jgi:hypothetical protein
VCQCFTHDMVCWVERAEGIGEQDGMSARGISGPLTKRRHLSTRSGADGLRRENVKWAAGRLGPGQSFSSFSFSFFFQILDF